MLTAGLQVTLAPELREMQSANRLLRKNGKTVVRYLTAAGIAAKEIAQQKRARKNAKRLQNESACLYGNYHHF